jgi:6-phosphogluconolactonase
VSIDGGDGPRIDGAPGAIDAAPGAPDAAAPSGPALVYVGASDNRIHVYELDPGTLALTPRSDVQAASGPTFLAFDPGRKFLVAVNEGNASIESFAIDGEDGALSRVDGASSGGNGPAHISMTPDGAFALVANYTAGTAAAVPVSATGELGEGGASVSPGAKAHQIVTNAAGTVAYVPCLGDDEIVVYGLAGGQLSEKSSASVADGAGPRHIALHPTRPLAYVLNELASTVTTFSVAADGALTSIDTRSALDEDFRGNNSGAEIEVHPSGRFLYASNRGSDTIAVFTIGEDGKPTLVGNTPTGGGHPRHFSLVLGGTALLVANRDADNITGFRVDPETGALTRVGGSLASVEGPQFVGQIYLPGE